MCSIGGEGLGALTWTLAGRRSSSTAICVSEATGGGEDKRRAQAISSAPFRRTETPTETACLARGVTGSALATASIREILPCGNHQAGEPGFLGQRHRANHPPVCGPLIAVDSDPTVSSEARSVVAQRIT